MSTITKRLLGKYIESSVQNEIISSLLDAEDYESCLYIIDTLEIHEEVAENVSLRIDEEVLAKTRKYISTDCELNFKEDFSFLALLKVATKLRQSMETLNEYLARYLSLFIFCNSSTLFGQSFWSQRVLPLLPADFDETMGNVNGQAIVEIVETILMAADNRENPYSLTDDLNIAKLLFILTGSRDEKVNAMAASLMKWWMPVMVQSCSENKHLDDSVWNFVQDNIEENYRTYIFKSSYVFWLRFLMGNGFSQSLLTCIKQDKYWNLIQQGLSHDLHELKKIALSILRFSLQLLGKNNLIDTNLIHFHGSGAELDAWKRYTTLYEIVGIDTALNQCEAALPDILELFEKQDLHKSWGLIIISTGLKATMESVRKFTLKLMLTIKDRQVFISNLKELREIFLPATMQASFFNVTDASCAYGDQLSLFVSDLVLASENREEMISVILQVLYDTRNAFDAARIYIADGVLTALYKMNTRILTSSHLDIIKKLFTGDCEEFVLQTTLQTIYLKFLLFTDVSPLEFIQVLVFCLKSNDNSYKFISGLLNSFRDFCIKNYPQKVSIGLLPKDTFYEIFAYELFDCEPDEISDDFLVELIKIDGNVSPMREEYYAFLTELVGQEIKDYTNSRLILDLSQFTHTVYSAINLDRFYEILLENFDRSKFDFFVALYKKVMESTSSINLEFDDLIKLYDLIKSDILDKKIASFKYKDELYHNFFNMFTIFLKSNSLTDAQIKKLLSLLTSNFEQDNGNYKGNLAIIELCECVLNTYIVPTIHNFEGEEKHIIECILALQQNMWSSLMEERLVLNQQPLQLAIIKGIFHHSILLYGLEYENVLSLVLKFGREVLDQAFSRRSFKPVLSRQILNFMSSYGNSLPVCDYSAFVELMIAIFTHNSMNLNIFNLKPVIAKLFDKKVGYYIEGGLYKSIYGDEEITTRVNIINSLLLTNKSFKSRFLEYMMKCDSNMLKAKKKTDGSEEIERLLKWQLSLLTIKSVDKTALTDICKNFIIPSLIEESSPLVRVYAEWFIAYDLWLSSSNDEINPNEEVLFEILSGYSKPVLETSVERLIFVALKELKDKSKCERLMGKYLAQLIANCTSNKPLIRHFSNSLILSFWPTFKDSISDNTLKTVIIKLYDDAVKMQMQGQFRAGDANIWNLLGDLQLTNIFGGVLLKITDHTVPYIRSKTFEKNKIIQSEFEIGRDEVGLWLSKRSSNDSSKANFQKDSPLQTKSGAWEVVMDFDNQKTLESVKRSKLVVVASLVDKPPNLGGICRLCDVLGVGTMTVHDIRVKNHPQFKNVAVTADRWMPIEEVPVDGIAAYMRKKKLEGYTLIGLEQTDSSIELNSDYKFPSKSLILLGIEAHGIPGYLLTELDLCLEIKQSGVIRSMNIQTATAVIVHSYSIQHL